MVLHMTGRNKILFFIMIFLWGSNWSAMKVALSIAPVFAYNYQRFCVTFLFLLLSGVILKVKVPKDKNVYKKVLIYAAFSTLGFAFTSIGLVSQSSGVGSVLTYTQPIWVFMLAVPFLSETFSLHKLIGILLGILGISILFLKDVGSIMSLSATVLVLGAFLWAVATVYYKLKLQNVDPVFVNTGHMAFATITLFLLSYFIEPTFTSWSWQYTSIVIYSGFGASGIGMTIWLILLKTEDATSLSSAGLIVPIIALFFGWVLINEDLGIKSVAGSALVLIGIYLVNHKLKQKGEVSNKKNLLASL